MSMREEFKTMIKIVVFLTVMMGLAFLLPQQAPNQKQVAPISVEKADVGVDRVECWWKPITHDGHEHSCLVCETRTSVSVSCLPK